MTSRGIRQSAAVMLVLCMPILANAADFTSVGNASNSDANHEVAEPVSIVQRYAGIDWYITAFMKFDHPPGPNVQIHTTFTDTPAGQWPQSVPVPGGLEKSGDPWLVENQTEGGLGPHRTYLVGTSWNGAQQSKDAAVCTLENRIMIWSSPNGGWMWYPSVIHSNPVGSGYFDDKPSALVSNFSRTVGRVYVAFKRARVDYSPEIPCTDSVPNGDGIYVYMFTPSAGSPWNGTATELARLPVPAANTTDPIIFEDQWGGALYVAWMEIDPTPPPNNASRIRVMASYDLGYTWITPGNASLFDPGLMGSGARVCDDNANLCAGSALGMSVAVSAYGSYGFIYHRRKPGSPGGFGVEVMYSRFTPGIYSPFSGSCPGGPCFANPVVEAADHYTWNPAIAPTSDGRFVITYYDYNHAEQSTLLRYRLSGTTLNADGSHVPGAEKVLYDNSAPSCVGPAGTTVCSELGNGAPTIPAYYYTYPANLGEYQGLFFWNGSFNAATVYVRGGVGNIYFVRGTP
jgi:hypothetical protein